MQDGSSGGASGGRRRIFLARGEPVEQSKRSRIKNFWLHPPESNNGNLGAGASLHLNRILINRGWICAALALSEEEDKTRSEEGFKKQSVQPDFGSQRFFSRQPLKNFVGPDEVVSSGKSKKTPIGTKKVFQIQTEGGQEPLSSQTRTLITLD